MHAYLWSVGEILAIDVLADEPPQRLDVVHRRPQRVHLARLKGRQKCWRSCHVKSMRILRSIKPLNNFLTCSDLSPTLFFRCGMWLRSVVKPQLTCFTRFLSRALRRDTEGVCNGKINMVSLLITTLSLSISDMKSSILLT